MEIHERIKKRRQELGISQQELAEEVGYSDRSSIAKIEKGKVDLPQSRIEAIAEALETTPAYLLEWTDDPYDWDKDPEVRLANAYGPRWDAVVENCGGDLSEAWKAWKEIDREQADEAQKMMEDSETNEGHDLPVSVIPTDYAKGDWLQTFAADPPNDRKALLEVFDQLNEEGRQKAVEYMRDLVLTGRYKRD